jgi:hypothetical protein
VAISLGHVALFGILDPFEIFHGLWPYRLGMPPYFELLILLKYFKAYGHIVGACRSILDL